MTVTLTNLSDNIYETSRIRLNISAKQFGIDIINSIDFNYLKGTDFYIDNKEVLNEKKGLGYWLWKPYIILESMKSLVEGDIVVYSDCGIEIIESITPLIDICKKQDPILLFGNGNFPNSIWTKRDCFILMDCDNETFWRSQHCDASFSLFRKCEQSIGFLNEWLKFARDGRILTDIPNVCGQENLSGFIEHRWDQSILSILAQKYLLDLYRMPTQYGNHYKLTEFRIEKEFNCVNQLNQSSVNHYCDISYHNSNYGQLLNHHREKSIQPTNQFKNLGEINKPKTSKIKEKTNTIKLLAAKIMGKLKHH